MEGEQDRPEGAKDTSRAHTIFDNLLLTTTELQADDSWWLRYNRR
jgi:hypothetical protein